MKRTIIILFALGFGTALLAQTGDDPEAIMKKSREMSKIDAMEAQSKLVIDNGKGSQRIRQTKMYSKIFPGGTEKRTIIFLSPADVKGTAILIWDYEDKEDNMWIYLPALRKSRKIVSSEKGRNFMGSEFSNADLAAGNIPDFKYHMEGSGNVDNQDCWKILVTPVTGRLASDYGYASKIMWIAKNDYMPRKTDFLDSSGKTFKEMTYSGIKVIDPKTGKSFITHMEVRNLENGRSSSMDMTNLVTGKAIGDEVFTLAFIERQ